MSITHHPAHIALIDETGQISTQEMGQYAAALNDDIQQNFGPVWHARAVVAVYTKETKPLRAWAVYIQARLDQPGALGYHADHLNQPVAYVELTNTVSVTISHETKEMLGDPSGNRMRSAPLPKGLSPDQVGLQTGAWVDYLVELCDPPEEVSYLVAGIPQSDHLLPPWYGQGAGPYSFAGGCTSAQEVADGGYVSFARSDNEWFQVFNQGGSLQVSDLGKFNSNEAKSLREWVDGKAREWRSSNGR